MLGLEQGPQTVVQSASRSSSRVLMDNPDREKMEQDREFLQVT